MSVGNVFIWGNGLCSKDLNKVVVCATKRKTATRPFGLERWTVHNLSFLVRRQTSGKQTFSPKGNLERFLLF